MEHILKILEDIKNSKMMLEHHENRLESLQNEIQSVFSVFVENASEQDMRKLIHHLYWYCDLDTNAISNLTKYGTRQIYKLAGPMYETHTCIQCEQQYIVEIRSKNKQPQVICIACRHNQYQQNRAKVLTMYLGKSVPKDYDKYLRSKHWKKTRKKALERAEYQCQLCACKDAVLDVHHNNYNNVGNEQEKDLIVLCRPCHRKFHTK